jgi:hypothetical protein
MEPPNCREGHEHIIEEFKALREEILFNFRTISQLQAFQFLSAGALIGVAYSQKDPNQYLLLAPVLIILPVMFLFGTQFAGIQKIGTYIQLYIEPYCSGLNWETRIAEFGKYSGPKSIWYRLVGFAYYIPGSSWVAIFICLSLSWSVPHTIPVGWHFLISFVTIFIALIATLQILKLHKKEHRDELLRLWKQTTLSQ